VFADHQYLNVRIGTIFSLNTISSFLISIILFLLFCFFIYTLDRKLPLDPILSWTHVLGTLLPLAIIIFLLQSEAAQQPIVNSLSAQQWQESSANNGIYLTAFIIIGLAQVAFIFNLLRGVTLTERSDKAARIVNRD